MFSIIYILTFFIGFLGAVANTLPPSATNLVIVRYASKKNLRKALHIAYGAALGELVVAGLALSIGVIVRKFYNDHTWLQIVSISLLAGAGIYFLLKKTAQDSNSTTSKQQRFINGLLLGALNIPMFIFWTAIFALSNNFIRLDENSPWVLIAMFLLGVFLGKFLVLYVYGKLSGYMTDNFSGFKGKLDTIIGVVLCIAALGQTLKLYME